MIIIRAILAVLDGTWLALKPALRFIAWLFALIATIALVNDITLWQLSNEAFRAVSVADHWEAFAPTSFSGTADALGSTAAWLWDPLLVTVLAAPVWVLFGCLAVFLAWLTRHRQRIQVFAN